MGNPIVTTASRSWTQITTLADALKGITQANGYLTDVGLNVWTTDHQRPSEDALGLMLYSESIIGPGPDRERPGAPLREFTILIEAAISTDLEDAQQQIHSVIDDIDRCITAYAKAQQRNSNVIGTPVSLADIAILDRPEGAAVIAMQARVITRYFP